MAVSYYQQHRPREATITISMTPDYSGDFICDGTADNVEIQAAVVYAEAVGGVVYIRSGDYEVIVTITITESIIIIGQGYDGDGTKFFRGAGMAGYFFDVDGTDHRIRVDFRDLLINTGGDNGIRYVSADGSLSNVYIAFADSSLYLDNVKYFLAFRSWFISGGDTGTTTPSVQLVSTTGACTFVKFFGCDFSGAEYRDVQIESDCTAFISNCWFEGDVTNQLRVEGRARVEQSKFGYAGTTCILVNGGDVIASDLEFGDCEAAVYVINAGRITLTDSKIPLLPATHTITIYGVYLETDENIIANNEIVGVSETDQGIYVSGGNNNIIIGNKVRDCDRSGILLLNADRNQVIANKCRDNDREAIGRPGIRLAGSSVDNLLVGNQCWDTAGTQDYGITEEGTSNYNRIFDNDLRANVTGGLQLIGDNTIAKNNAVDGLNSIASGVIIASKIFQFIQGTTFISADGSAKGWEINAEADMAIALGQLPSEVQQVIRIKIWAVALGAPAGAGGQMHLDILFNAGGSLEAWNLGAKSWTLANFDGEEVDYVNTNVIHWVMEDGDVGNELRNILGGDSLELKVNGGTAVAPDGATNATFRTIEIEYL